MIQSANNAPKVRVALITFSDVIRELGELNKLLQRSDLTTIEALQFAKVGISKLHQQYFGGEAFWSDGGSEFMDRNPDIDVAPTMKFDEHLCLHLDSRFLEKRARKTRLDYI